MAYVRGHQSGFDELGRGGRAPTGATASAAVSSAAPRTTRAARPIITARAARWPSPTRPIRTPATSRFSRRRANSGFARVPPMGLQRRRGRSTAPASIRRTSTTAAATRRPTPFLAPALSRPNLVVWPEARRPPVRSSRAGARRASKSFAQGVARHRPRAPRGHARRRRDRVAEDPDALGHRTGRRAACARHRRRARSPGVGANLHDHPRVSVRWHSRAAAAASTCRPGSSRRRCHDVAGSPPDLQFYVGRGLDDVEPFVTLTVALTRPAAAADCAALGRSAARRDHGQLLQRRADLDALVEGVRLARPLPAAAPTTRCAARLRLHPRTPTRPADIRAFIRATADTIFHPAGTCRMGGDARRRRPAAGARRRRPSRRRRLDHADGRQLPMQCRLRDDRRKRVDLIHGTGGH